MMKTQKKYNNQSMPSNFKSDKISLEGDSHNLLHHIIIHKINASNFKGWCVEIRSSNIFRA